MALISACLDPNQAVINTYINFAEIAKNQFHLLLKFIIDTRVGIFKFNIMKYFNRLQIVLLIYLFHFLACSPHYYSPTTQNVPLIESKHQVNISISGYDYIYELQGAYGLTNHISLMANGVYFQMDESLQGNNGYGYLAEFGIGYYTIFKNNIILETYLMGAKGEMENRFNTNKTFNTSGFINAQLVRWSNQTNIGIRKKNWEYAISAKTSLLKYSNISGDLIFEDVDQNKYLHDNSLNVLFEPAFTLRYGFKWGKIQLQYTTCHNFSNKNFRQYKDHLSIGANFNLGGKKNTAQ